MTRRQEPRPNGLNAAGNGKGLKVVTRPVTRKRGSDAAKVPAVIAENRKNYTSLSNMPADQVALLADPNRPLTEKAKLFVKYWAQGESVFSASARAGYGDGATYAYKLTKLPQAIALYNEEKRLYEESCQMTRKKVMDGLLGGIEMAKLAGEPASVITGWKTVGQMCGYFEPRKVKVDVNLSGNATMQQMSKLSDAELLRVIQQGVQNDLAQLQHDSDAEDDG